MSKEKKTKKQEIGDHFDEGKAPIHLIPVEAILGTAHVFGMGAKKYGEYNFRKGIRHTQIINSLLRHTLAYLDGEDNDPESGKSHIYHAMANCAMLIYMIHNKPELDDRYKPTTKKRKKNNET